MNLQTFQLLLLNAIFTVVCIVHRLCDDWELFSVVFGKPHKLLANQQTMEDKINNILFTRENTLQKRNQ